MRPIDANALIAEMHNVILEDGEDRRIFYKVIERQPTIEIPQWVSCSERLPSEGEYVLVTEKWHGYVWMWRLQYIDNEPTWEANGYNVDIDEAVAWMPLPEPYREEDK